MVEDENIQQGSSTLDDQKSSLQRIFLIFTGICTAEFTSAIPLWVLYCTAQFRMYLCNRHIVIFVAGSKRKRTEVKNPRFTIKYKQFQHK